MMPSLVPDGKKRKSVPSYRRDDRLNHDGARHPDVPRRAPPADDINLVDHSPLSLSGDDMSAGNFLAPIMVRGEDPTSDNVFDTDVRHRMFKLLRNWDVSGKTATLSQAYIKTNLVGPLIKRRNYLCNKAKDIDMADNLEATLELTLSNHIPFPGGERMKGGSGQMRARRN